LTDTSLDRERAARLLSTEASCRAAGPHEAFFLNITPHQEQETRSMWKLVVGFIVFAAVSLFIISKAGDKVDMSGEKHGGDAVHVPTPAPPAASAPK
jgi:hypothetical protein